jgi:hypothetical protein
MVSRGGFSIREMEWPYLSWTEKQAFAKELTELGQKLREEQAQKRGGGCELVEGTRNIQKCVMEV